MIQHIRYFLRTAVIPILRDKGSELPMFALFTMIFDFCRKYDRTECHKLTGMWILWTKTIEFSEERLMYTSIYGFDQD